MLIPAGAVPVILLALLFASVRAQADKCLKPEEWECNESIDYFPAEARVTIHYANSTLTNFKYSKTYVDFTVVFTDDSDMVDFDYTCRIVVCGCPLPDTPDPQPAAVFFTYPKHVFIEDGPTIAAVAALIPDLDMLAYVGQRSYVYNPVARSRVENGKAMELMENGIIKYTKLNDDNNLGAIMSSTFGFNQTLTTLDELESNVPMLPMAEAEELSPLARAEWVKIAGLLFNRTEKANTFFNKIVSDYDAAKKIAASAIRRPSVFFNIPFASFDANKSFPLDDRYTWQITGGDTYIGHFMRDANADYRYNADASASTNVSEVVRNFFSARFLLNAGAPERSDNLSTWIDNLGIDGPDDELKTALLKLAAVRCGKVWAQNRRLVEPEGDSKLFLANDFFESAVMDPHLVLKDYVTILHPDVEVPDHKLTYMRRIEGEDELEADACPYVDLLAKVGDGAAYVDKTLTVEGMNRFEVEDSIEGKINPALTKGGVKADTVDIQFRTVSTATTVTVTVRANMSLADAGDFDKSKAVEKAFSSSLGKDAKTKETSSQVVERGVSLSSGSISTGATAGIAVASVGLLLALIVILILMSRRRGNGHQPILAGGGSGDDYGGGTGATGNVPTAHSVTA